VTKKLAVQVIGDESTDPGRLDELGRQLAKDLRAAGHLAVDPVPAAPPQMAKSGVKDEIAYWIISGAFSATTVRAIRDVIVAYLERTRARAVRVRVGEREVTLEGASATDLAAVTQLLTTLVPAEPPAEP
jgi:Effector Associated Constant Component 1